MKFSEIMSRLTGISTPIGGVSWTPPKADVEVARALLAFLENRRVLYVPTEVEAADHCIQSVLQIREHLTQVLIEQGIATSLCDHLRAMRAACRKFLGWFNSSAQNNLHELYIPSYRNHHNGLQDWQLNQALGELRGVFGIHIAQIAVDYGLEVEDQLAVVLPLAPNDE